MERKKKIIFSAISFFGFAGLTYLLKKEGFHYPPLFTMMASILSGATSLFWIEKTHDEKRQTRIRTEEVMDAISDLNSLLSKYNGLAPTGSYITGTTNSWNRHSLQIGTDFEIDLESKQVLVSEKGDGNYVAIRPDKDSDVIEVVKGYRDTYPTLSVMFTDDGGVKLIDSGFLTMHEDWQYAWPDGNFNDLFPISDYIRVHLKNLLIHNSPVVTIPSSEVELRFTSADTAWLSTTRGNLQSLKVSDDIESIDIVVAGKDLYRLVPTQMGIPTAFRRVKVTQ